MRCLNFGQKVLHSLKFVTAMIAFIYIAVPSVANVGSVWLKQDAFVSPEYDSTTQKSYHFIGADFSNSVESQQKKDEQDSSGLRSEISGEFAVGQPALSYLNIEQLYWQQDGLSAGRKKYLWSELEQTWDLGFFQPQFSGRPLVPSAQGLTGLFLDVENDYKSWSWGSVIYASPLFIPDQGASYQIEDGKFKSNNPWFPNPPSEVSVLGQKDSIKYNIEVPEINKIIFNSSFGAMAYVEMKPYGFFARASVASKPSNQLVLGVDGAARETNEVEVDVRPQFFNHSLFSTDLGYDTKYVGGSVGFLQERASEAEFEQKWNYPVYGLTNFSMISIWAKPLPKTKATASYLKVDSQELKAIGPKGSSFEGLFTERTYLTDAYKLKLESNYKTGRKQVLNLDVHWTESIRKDWTLTGLEIDWQFERFWSLKAAAHFIKVSDEVDEGNFYQFQNNDVVGVGVAYVF